MKHGFVRVAAASPDLRVGNPAYNAQKIIEVINEQAQRGTEILVFPELCLSGYTCGDLFFQKTLLEECLTALKAVADATKDKTMLVFVGLPFEAQAGKVYNCAAAISGGVVEGLIPKTYVPNYGEFYEQRYFMQAWDEDGYWIDLPWGDRPYFGKNFLIEDKHGVTVACEICEDLWAPTSPSSKLAVTKANIIVNLSASDETVGKREYRHTLVSAQSGKCVCGYIYCDAGMYESTNDCVFAGNHLIYENGTLLSEAKPFEGDVCEAEIDVGFLNHERRRLNTFHDEEGIDNFCFEGSFIGDGDLKLRRVPTLPFVPQGEKLSERAETILQIQSQALAKRLKHIGSRSAVLGVSGGLDSALALLVTVRAFELLNKPKEDIIAISMPCFGTSKKTKSNASLLAKALGVTFKVVPIAKTVTSHFKDIGQDMGDHDLTFENAQARYRTMVLMDVACQTGGIVVGTGDLSELALGWCTYNGDHMSNYSVNSSVPKTLVKHLVAYEGKRIGGRVQRVLQSILDTEISPELLPPDKEGKIAQKTEDIVGPYELHDFFLYRILRCGDEPEKVYYLAKYAFGDRYDGDTIKKWLKTFYKRFFSQQFKRNCVPDGVKVGSVSLSPRADWRMPSDADAQIWLERVEKL